jgi:2-dehydropantoate 2-reductase
VDHPGHALWGQIGHRRVRRDRDRCRAQPDGPTHIPGQIFPYGGGQTLQEALGHVGRHSTEGDGVHDWVERRHPQSLTCAGVTKCRMRFVVFGAGAIGGLVGARLFQHGADVTLVARGDHARALTSGLVLEAPDESVTLAIPVVTEARGVQWSEDTVVLLGVKGQHTEEALAQLVRVAPPETPVVCMQNGVENERRVLRRFPRTYAMCVMCPATHLRPGVIQAHSAPVSGLLDLGRYPAGVDAAAQAIAGALDATTFQSVARPDIMRWKYRKLLMNLANAVEALCGPAGRGSALALEAQREGAAVLEGAGIAVASVDEDRARRSDHLQMRNTRSGEWRGGSSWQSLLRGTGSIEAEFLNGEIVLLGALHGMPTPVNALLQRLAVVAAAKGSPPGEWSVEELSAAAGLHR